MLFDANYVIEVHDAIVHELGGLPGLAGGSQDRLESALARIENHAAYAGVNDVFGIAALYAVAIARGHVFNDGNKRTGLTCALAYLLQQGIDIQEFGGLEDVMVAVAEGSVEAEDLADLFSALWDLASETPPGSGLE